jgi:hypothetical protein
MAEADKGMETFCTRQKLMPNTDRTLHSLDELAHHDTKAVGIGPTCRSFDES